MRGDAPHTWSGKRIDDVGEHRVCLECDIVERFERIGGARVLGWRRPGGGILFTVEPPCAPELRRFPPSGGRKK